MVYYILSHFSPLGWHTYSTALIAHGENVKVVQELMRHASRRFTLEVYTQAKVKRSESSTKDCGDDRVG
jgi:site-specific recombinase XerD